MKQPMKKRVRIKQKLKEFKDSRGIESLFLLIFCIIISLFVKEVNASENNINPSINNLLSENVGTRTCLVYNLFHESRSESDMANIMVLNTVFNRVKSEHYPNTPCDVIKQNRQYSWTQDGKSDKMRNLKQVKRLTKLVDKYLMNRGMFLSLSEKADHYHTNNIKPVWSKSKRMDRVAVIDNHTFYVRK